MDAQITPLPELSMRFCKDCTHLCGIRHKLETALTEWECYAPRNIISRSVNLVTGDPIVQLKISKIELCRNECAGDWWEKYQHPSRTWNGEPATVPSTPSHAPAKTKLSNITLADL